MFTAVAKSDPDTPITYTWYGYDEQSDCENKWCIVHNVANKTYILHDTYSLMMILDTNASDIGTYRCIASNGMTQDVLEVKLLAAPDCRMPSSTTPNPLGKTKKISLYH